MKLQKIKNILILGAGEMGWQLALIFAQKRKLVYLYDINTSILKKAEERITKNLKKRQDKGKIDQERFKKILSNVIFIENWPEFISKVDIVLETIPEDLKLKKEIFSELNKYFNPVIIYGSNSSTIGIHNIVKDLPVEFQKNCLNIHFCNPPFMLKLVELYSGSNNTELLEHVKKTLRKMKFSPIILDKPISGFVMNRIMGGALIECFKLLDNGICNPEDIDVACTAGLNWPIGLMRLADFMGLDTVYNSLVANYEETKEEYFKPSQYLEKLVKSGRFGMKSKNGIYTYDLSEQI